MRVLAFRKHLCTIEKKGVLLNSSVSYVSGDRAREGIFHLWDIFDNIIIGNLDQVKKDGF